MCSSKQAHDDQIKLKREYDEAMGRENQGEDQGERIQSESAKTQTTTTYSPTYPIHKQIFGQHSKQIKPLDHNSKTPKSS